MANNQEEEANPLLPLPVPPTPTEADKATENTSPVGKLAGEGEWTAQGVPIGQVSVVGQPVRNQWSSGLFSCLGRRDEFYSSDLEVSAFDIVSEKLGLQLPPKWLHLYLNTFGALGKVPCIYWHGGLLGSMVPCVLYGSNEERMSTEPAESFSNNCRLYTALYVLGNFLFGWNSLAPWYSYRTRTAIRQKYNLEGNFESFARSSGCLSGIANDARMLEGLEETCDLMTHFLCHQCALCQEGRELRRRAPHPGFFVTRPVYAMVPPTEQTMGHGAPP